MVGWGVVFVPEIDFEKLAALLCVSLDSGHRMYYHQCVVAMDSGSLIQDYMIAQVSSSMKCFNMYIVIN